MLSDGLTAEPSSRMLQQSVSLWCFAPSDSGLMVSAYSFIERLRWPCD